MKISVAPSPKGTNRENLYLLQVPRQRDARGMALDQAARKLLTWPSQRV